MRPRQTILLGLLLLVPVLAFLFLYGFGQNHYALPTYLPERTDAVRPSAGGGQRDTVYHQIRPFRLLAMGDHYIASSTLGQGLYVVQVAAGETASNEVDVQASRAMVRLQEKFRGDPRVRLVTILPYPDIVKADANSLLEEVSERDGTISGKWFVLAASPQTVDSLARYEFGLLTAQPSHLPFQPTAAPGNLTPGRLLLIDRDRHVRGYYDGTNIHEVERLITEISVLLYTYDHRN